MIDYYNYLPTMFKDYPEVITIDELQAILHIGRNSAYTLLKEGAIETLRVGKKYIIPKLSVMNFLMEGFKK